MRIGSPPAGHTLCCRQGTERRLTMNPAQQLKGMTLDDGWYVRDFATRKPNATGGFFSQGYIVERNGQEGFLKALDYEKALQAQNAPQMLLAMTQGFEF